MQALASAVATFALLASLVQPAVCRPSRIVFFELTVKDLTKAKSFYGQLFGWTFSKSPSADFVSIEGSGISGGILRDPAKKISSDDGVKIFCSVDDVAATLEKAKELGAVVVLGETRVSPTRTLAEFRDRDGNLIGIMHSVAK